MPVAVDTEYQVPPYQRPAQTKKDLDWANLVTIDVSRFDEPGEKQRLAAELDDAVRNVGFWVVVGHGIPDEEVVRMLAIAKAFFDRPMEDKTKVPIDLGNGRNFGYREPVRKLGPTGWKESVETYELHKDIPELDYLGDHPFIQAFHSETAPFMKKMYDRILKPLYTLIAIILELPEDYFVSRCAWDRRSECWLRMMLHPPRPQEYYDASELYNIGGHTDQSSLTVLWEQHVAGLQMQTMDGQWKWVKPVKGGCTINAGELISLMTKGYVKATIHRVHGPPEDQMDVNRLGLIYFSLMNDDTKVVPAPSPKLKRLGLVTEADYSDEAIANAPTSVEYTQERMKRRHHLAEFKKRDASELFTFKGLKVKNTYD